jgi:hypothetical protein
MSKNRPVKVSATAAAQLEALAIVAKDLAARIRKGESLTEVSVEGLFRTFDIIQNQDLIVEGK